MKTYEQLTKQEQEQAIDQETNDLLRAIIEGAVRFNDKLNGDDLQARIDEAIERAHEMQTPWFAHEYIMDTCADDIRSIASSQATTAIYLEDGEHAIRLSKQV